MGLIYNQTLSICCRVRSGGENKSAVLPSATDGTRRRLCETGGGGAGLGLGGPGSNVSLLQSCGNKHQPVSNPDKEPNVQDVTADWKRCDHRCLSCRLSSVTFDFAVRGGKVQVLSKPTSTRVQEPSLCSGSPAPVRARVFLPAVTNKRLPQSVTA